MAGRSKDSTPSSMTSVFSAPRLPVTPSAAINDMLQRRCGRQYENLAANAVAYGVCYMFHGVMAVYKLLRRSGVGGMSAEMGDMAPSQRLWTAACAVVGAGGALCICLFYRVLMAAAPLFHATAYYIAMLLAISFIALATAGAMFFDKPPPAGYISRQLDEDYDDITVNKYK